MKLTEKNRPDFFIVGAPKCGTTALHYYLSKHPKIFMAQKELYYFGKDFTFKEGLMQLDYYLNFFKDAKASQIKGDNSVWHLFSKVASKEIFKFNPKAKIIILLRNPTDMIYSLHSQQVYNGNENEANFEQALTLQKSRLQGKNIPKTIGCPIEALQYFEVGKYYEQVKRYLDVFDSSQIKIIFFEEVQSDLKKVNNEIFEFLHVESIKIEIKEKINSNKKSKNKFLLNLLKFRSLWFVNLIKTLIPLKKMRDSILSKLWKLNTKEVARKPMNEKTKLDLKKYFFEDIKQLENLLEVDLSSWK